MALLYDPKAYSGTIPLVTPPRVRSKRRQLPICWEGTMGAMVAEQRDKHEETTRLSCTAIIDCGGSA